ncbi:MAG: peptidoglycan DD-metalloendopeptidase family protein [Acidobacteriota bacterium]|nr:peptidoglycan DD-metalloendopeptidase family protein [Acidobacteriota bacterium]MDQ5836263.1 peptidoglycan DD-metalloendopeptidase family protein [Acidobacteriota bacterium]
MPLGPRARVLLIAAVLFAALAALVWYLSTAYWSQPVTPLAPPSHAGESATPQATATPAAPSSQATPTPLPSATASPSSQTTATPMPSTSPAPAPSPRAQASSGDANEVLASMRLLIPVEGVRPSQLQDTFDQARSEGRVHDAIDIMAPRGTPVLAAADGRVVKLFQSAKGGTTVYQLAAPDEHFVFYYAHLDHYAEGLSEGRLARRGETIGYVGDTGNAGPGNTHLHFQIYRVADPKHFWTGENINPYPILRNAE